VGLGLVSAFFGAASYVTIRRIRRDPPILVVFYFSVITAALALPLAARGWMGVSPVDVLLLVGIGVATHVGQLCITWGFRMERAGRASAVGYLQIVFAAAWGWVLFDEIPDGWMWVGACAIVLATLGIARQRAVPATGAPSATR
jgi:drug/metabolite transporter (DMT)-like permease